MTRGLVDTNEVAEEERAKLRPAKKKKALSCSTRCETPALLGSKDLPQLFLENRRVLKDVQTYLPSRPPVPPPNGDSSRGVTGWTERAPNKPGGRRAFLKFTSSRRIANASSTRCSFKISITRAAMRSCPPPHTHTHQSRPAGPAHAADQIAKTQGS